MNKYLELINVLICSILIIFANNCSADCYSYEYEEQYGPLGLNLAIGESMNNSNPGAGNGWIFMHLVLYQQSMEEAAICRKETIDGFYIDQK